jgi:hypothetical protein
MRPCQISIALLSASVLGAGAGPASAQPRPMVAFGHVAFVDVVADDHGVGTMTMYGGELVLPLGGAFHAGIDVEAGSIARTDPFRFGQTAVTISASGEWPRTARVRGMAGGGAGWLFQRLSGV